MSQIVTWPRITLFLQRAVLYIAIGIVWELIAGGFGQAKPIIDPLFIGRPSRIASDLADIMGTGSIWPDLLITLSEAFGGLLVGVVLGVAIGFAFAYSEPLARLFDPLLVAINALPRPALAPLFLLWFGFGVGSKILVSFSLVFFVILYNTLLGLRSIDGDVLNAVRVMGANRAQTIRLVVLPSVFAWIFAGLRTSVGYALIGAVLGEFVGATGGLGYRLLIAEGLLATNRVFSILIILAVVGVLLTQISQWIEDRVLRWKPTVSIG